LIITPSLLIVPELVRVLELVRVPKLLLMVPELSIVPKLSIVPSSLRSVIPGLMVRELSVSIVKENTVHVSVPISQSPLMVSSFVHDASSESTTGPTQALASRIVSADDAKNTTATAESAIMKNFCLDIRGLESFSLI